MRQQAIVLTTSLFLAACGAGMMSDLKERAAADLRCAEAAITFREHGDWAHQTVTGCGKTNVYVTERGQWSSPYERATFDLSCPEEKLSAQFLGEDSVGVTGCDKKATYLRVRKGPGNYEWVMNTTSEAM